MKTSSSCWQTAGFLFCCILGTFFHFLFELCGQNVIIALFCPVNESIWEHMKLFYYPMLMFSCIENRFWGKHSKNFWCIKLIGLSLGLALIPLTYYTYTGILGVSSHWVNIAIFFLSAGVVFWLENKLFQLGHYCRMSSGSAIFLICTISILFTVLTFSTPKIPFFLDPITGTYGFQG